MVSEKTLKLTIWIIRVGSFLKVFPAIWDPQEKCVRSKYGKFTLILFSNKYFRVRWNINTCQLFQMIYLLLHISFLAYLMHVLFFQSHNKMDFYLCVMVLFGMCMSLVAQINFYYFSDGIFMAFNSILGLDKSLRKYSFITLS